MIDFRYHLVSIVAIFLALATGIIIGATSLRDDVAGTLNGQVGQLREDKKGLRSQLDSSQLANRRQDQYAAEMAPAALAGQLRGRSTVVVSLPGTAGSLTDGTVDTLHQADATVTETAELSDGWADGSADTRRALHRAARTMRMDVGDVPDNRLAGLVLANALSTEPGHQRPTGQAAARGQLVDAGLVDLSDEDAASAQSVVVVWPGMRPPQESEPNEVSRWSDVITAVGLSGRPVVGGSSGPVKAGVTADALVAQLRDSAQVTGTMSTVDDMSSPVGRGAAALALRDEFRDQSGNYGLDQDASAVAPQLDGSS